MHSSRKMVIVYKISSRYLVIMCIEYHLNS
nr:MAG TPA: hypothetical protein [Caudoviricetes sp.]